MGSVGAVYRDMLRWVTADMVSYGSCALSHGACNILQSCTADTFDGVGGLYFFNEADAAERFNGDEGQSRGNGGECTKFRHNGRGNLHNLFCIVIKAGKTAGGIQVPKLDADLMRQRRLIQLLVEGSALGFILTIDF